LVFASGSAHINDFNYNLEDDRFWRKDRGANGDRILAYLDCVFSYCVLFTDIDIQKCGNRRAERKFFCTSYAHRFSWHNILWIFSSFYAPPTKNRVKYFRNWYNLYSYISGIFPIITILTYPTTALDLLHIGFVKHKNLSVDDAVRAFFTFEVPDNYVGRLSLITAPLAGFLGFLIMAIVANSLVDNYKAERYLVISSVGLTMAVFVGLSDIVARFMDLLFTYLSMS
jgi:hypothetical protein